MEVLAKAAIAEIIQLFDDSYAVLRLEISRHQNENEDLKRKLQEAKEELKTQNVQIRIEADDMVRQDWSSPFRTGRGVNRDDGSPHQPLSTEDKCLGVQEQEPNLMQIKEERLEDELWHQGLESMKYETPPAGDSCFSQRLFAESSGSQCRNPESAPEQQHQHHSFPFTPDRPGQTAHVSRMPMTDVSSHAGVVNAHLTYPQSSDVYASDPVTHFADVHSPRMALKHTPQTVGRALVDAQDSDVSAATHLPEVEEEFGALRLKAEQQQEDELASVGRGASRTGAEPACGSEPEADHDHGDALLWGPLTEETDGGGEQGDSDTNHSFEDLLYGVEQYGQRPHGDELHLVDDPQTPPSLGGGTGVEVFAAGTCVAATQPQTQPHLLQPQRMPHLTHPQGRPRQPPPPPTGPPSLHVCSICKKGFSTLPYLRKHLRSHSGERPFTCAVCYKHFLCSSHLTIHLRTHTGERPYACGTCGKRFTQQSSLKTHQSVHSGLRPYSCPHCGKNYTLMHHLKRHMGTHEKS